MSPPHPTPGGTRGGDLCPPQGGTWRIQPVFPPPRCVWSLPPGSKIERVEGGSQPCDPQQGWGGAGERGAPPNLGGTRGGDICPPQSGTSRIQPVSLPLSPPPPAPAQKLRDLRGGHSPATHGEVGGGTPFSRPPPPLSGTHGRDICPRQGGTSRIQPLCPPPGSKIELKVGGAHSPATHGEVGGAPPS